MLHLVGGSKCLFMFFLCLGGHHGHRIYHLHLHRNHSHHHSAMVDGNKRRPIVVHNTVIISHPYRVVRGSDHGRFPGMGILTKKEDENDN
jgi:hypothetical protein